jgi:hypothetical protein
MLLNGITALGKGRRVTIWIEATTLGIPDVKLLAKNVHGVNAASVNRV